MLKELTYSGKAICPISNAVFLELYKQKNQDERQAIASVMDEFSKGLTIQSKYFLFREELLNFSNDQIHKPWRDVAEFTTVFQEKIIDTPEWKRLYNSQKSLPSISQLSSSEIVGDIEVLNNIEANINSYLQEQKEKHDNEARDFKLMQAVEILNAIKSVFEIFPELESRISNIKPQDIGPDIHLKMPSIWSFASIHSLLRNDPQRKYRVNDHFDIEHCSIALGYFDYLFTERSFFSVFVIIDLVKNKLISMEEDKELLDIVDEQDNIITQDTKENKFKKELISRNVAIFILDDNKNLLIVKRSPQKRSFPNRYDLAACGNVKAGESYEKAADREVEEELGIKCDLMFLTKIFNKFKENKIEIKYFTGLFLGHWSDDVTLGDELVELKKLSIQEVEELINQNQDLFTPGFVKDFISVKDKLK